MNHQQSNVGPGTNSFSESGNIAIDNNNLARFVVNLSRKIVNMADRIQKIEASTGPSKRTGFLRDEISSMEALLVNIMMKGQFHF